jgi:hypothetical protein
MPDGRPPERGWPVRCDDRGQRREVAGRSDRQTKLKPCVKAAEQKRRVLRQALRQALEWNVQTDAWQ